LTKPRPELIMPHTDGRIKSRKSKIKDQRSKA
jgi:hypothetical protein